MKNKLYVWEGFEPDHTNGLAFAIAPSLEKAEAMVVKRCGGYQPYDWGELEILDLSSECVYLVSGGA